MELWWSTGPVLLHLWRCDSHKWSRSFERLFTKNGGNQVMDGWESSLALSFSTLWLFFVCVFLICRDTCTSFTFPLRGRKTGNGEECSRSGGEHTKHMVQTWCCTSLHRAYITSCSHIIVTSLLFKTEQLFETNRCDRSGSLPRAIYLISIYLGYRSLPIMIKYYIWIWVAHS